MRHNPRLKPGLGGRHSARICQAMVWTRTPTNTYSRDVGVDYQDLAERFCTTSILGWIFRSQSFPQFLSGANAQKSRECSHYQRHCSVLPPIIDFMHLTETTQLSPLNHRKMWIWKWIECCTEPPTLLPFRGNLKRYNNTIFESNLSGRSPFLKINPCFLFGRGLSGLQFYRPTSNFGLPIRVLAEYCHSFPILI